MRICMVCPDLGIPLGGCKGASTHLRGLARGFQALGHEVHVMATEHPENAAAGLPFTSVTRTTLATDLHDRVSRPMARALDHLWNNVAVEETLSRLLIRFAPDLVYERHSPLSAAGGLVCSRLGVPHVLEVNAPLAFEGSRYRRQALMDATEALERAAFDAAGRIVVVSSVLRDLLVEDGVSAEKIRVVPNGVATDLFSPAGQTAEVGPKGRVVVGFVGSLKPWHGLGELMEVFTQIADRLDLHLLAVGDGPMASLLESGARRLPGRVTHVAAVPQPEVPRYLRAMDIAVAPYPPLDPFYFSPLKVLEYMATGRAIVASSIGQISELIEHDRSGWLVPAGDLDALAGALDHLSTSPDDRQRLGTEAARAAANGCDWRNRAKQILQWATEVHRCSA